MYKARSYYCQPAQARAPKKKRKLRRPPPVMVAAPRNVKNGLYEQYYFFKQGKRLPNLGARLVIPNEVRYGTGSLNYGGKIAWPIAPHSNFAARYDGILYIRRSGTYKFFVGSDDGSKLWIDRRRVVNNDGRHGYRTRSGVRKLNRIQHRLLLTFFEAGGKDRLTLRYKGPDTRNKVQFVHARNLKHEVAKGWKEEIFYKKGMKAVPSDLGSPDNTRVVAKVEYRNTQRKWPGFSRNDDFAVRWTGKMSIFRVGRYRFQLGSDDGSNLYVDGKPVVKNDGLHGFRNRFGDYKMKKGKSDLRLEFFERGGSAGMVLKYMGPDTKNRLTVVPSRVMEAAMDVKPKADFGELGGLD
jgi:hypothetical protein